MYYCMFNYLWIMEKDEFPSYKVVEKGSVKILMQLNLTTGQYRAVGVGARGYYGGNALVLWDKQNHGELFWLSEDMENCRLVFGAKTGESVKKIARIGSMFLVELEKDGRHYYKAIGVQKAGSYDYDIAFKQFCEAQIEADYSAPQKYVSCDIDFWEEEDSDRTTYDVVLCGEKVKAPENVHAFWNGKVFTMLGRYFQMYFLVREECKSFRAEVEGFVLTRKDGTKDLFPYCPFKLECEA